MEQETTKKTMSRGKKMGIASLAFLATALLCFIYWNLFLKNKVSTDDAYVHGNRVLIQSEVSSNCTAFFIDDNEYVHEGQLLVTLDTTAFRLQLDEALSILAQTARQVKSLQEETVALSYQQEGVANELQRALYDFENRLALQPMQAVPNQEVEHAKIEVARLTNSPYARIN